MDHDIAAAADIADGSMRKIEIAGRTLLLARVGAACHAIDNVCPHAGGPLDEGTLDGETVICPWHKAAFSVVSGEHVEPPALDDVERFAVRIENGRVIVAIDGHAVAGAADEAPHKDERCFAIIGAGAAGAVAAQTLRKNGFGGRIVLIGRKNALPYDRTVLSKYTIAGTEAGEKTPLQNEAFYRDHRIERMVGSVVRVDPGARRIVLENGGTLAYDEALVATGGAPKRLKIEGEGLPGVFALRSIADANAIAAAAARAGSAIVAGAGFIAMEAAASLRQRGLEVTVIAPQKTPFERQLGTEIGGVLQRLLAREGVVFRLQDEITAIIGHAHVEAVRLRSGASLPADMVIIGMGITPATGMLPAGLRHESGGVDVDSHLRVTDHLFAAGDIAAAPLRTSGERVRVEHWRVAQQHGKVAALNMLGHDLAYDAVPYFWTTFFSKRLDYVGHAETWDDIVIDGDMEKPEFIAYYLRGAAVAAVAGLGRDRQMAACLTIMTAQRDISLETLRQAIARTQS